MSTRKYLIINAALVAIAAILLFHIHRSSKEIERLEKAKADKWTIKSNDDFGNFRGLVLTKNGKWLRVTDNKSRMVSQVAYAYAG